MSARREFLISLGAALAWSLLARAQLPRTMYRIGFLGNSTAALEANLIEPFRQGLRELGYEEGRNITIEYRWAEGKYERLPALISELVALNLDVMVTAGTPATRAVKKSSDLGAAGHGRYRRSRRRRCGAEPRATRRQHYGAQRDGDRPRRQAAATARGSCYWPVARCGNVESAKRVSGNFYQGVERRRRNLENQGATGGSWGRGGSRRCIRHPGEG